MINLDNGHKIVLQVLASDTVALVKRLLHKACGTDPSLQLLSSGTRALSNDDLTMEECYIMPNAVLGMARCRTPPGRDTPDLPVNTASTSQTAAEPASSEATPQQVPPTFLLLQCSSLHAGQQELLLQLFSSNHTPRTTWFLL